MIDLHCHILPGLDDGAADLNVSLEMARIFVEQGVTHVACTSHILPGLYPNQGPNLRSAVVDLQRHIDAAGLPLRLLSGADNHIVPNMVQHLRDGTLLTLENSRYVLVEPPHHVAPRGLDDLFFSLTVAGFVPILTHPERLSWIKDRYASIQTWVGSGVWMQITAGSLAGTFGRNALYWAERFLDDGFVHILATDAHDTQKRPPDLRRGRDLVAKRLGEVEADRLVRDRPAGVIANVGPSELPAPPIFSGIRREDPTGRTQSSTTGSPLDRLARRMRSFLD